MIIRNTGLLACLIFGYFSHRAVAVSALKPTQMSLTTKIILGLIVLHLLVGFGWLIYKVSPRKGDKPENENPE